MRPLETLLSAVFAVAILCACEQMAKQEALAGEVMAKEAMADDNMATDADTVR